MTDRRPPGWVRPNGGRADLRAGGAGCARLPLRSHRRRPGGRDRRRSLDGGHCAREARRCRPDPSRYRLAWGVRAGWPDRSSVAAEQADAEPADGEPATRAGRLDGPVLDFVRRISAHSATPTNSRPASRTGARRRNPTRRQPAPSGNSTDAAEESSAGAHTPRRCALLPSRVAVRPSRPGRPPGSKGQHAQHEA
jgi:hypothetical protein